MDPIEAELAEVRRERDRLLERVAWFEEVNQNTKKFFRDQQLAVRDALSGLLSIGTNAALAQGIVKIRDGIQPTGEFRMQVCAACLRELSGFEWSRLCSGCRSTDDDKVQAFVEAKLEWVNRLIREGNR